MDDAWGVSHPSDGAGVDLSCLGPVTPLYGASGVGLEHDEHSGTRFRQPGVPLRQTRNLSRSPTARHGTQAGSPIHRSRHPNRSTLRQPASPLGRGPRRSRSRSNRTGRERLVQHGDQRQRLSVDLLPHEPAPGQVDRQAPPQHQPHSSGSCDQRRRRTTGRHRPNHGPR